MADGKFFLSKCVWTYPLVLQLLPVIKLLNFKKRQNINLKQLSHLHNEFLTSKIEIQEQTFRTANHEIHDNIGQVLSLAKLQLHRLKNQPLFEETLQPTLELLGKAINDLRDLTKTINPGRFAQVGLSQCIGIELNNLQKTNNLETKFEINGQFHPLTAEKEMILFRVFQELMNKAINHVKTSHLCVSLAYQPESVKLTVSDDGIDLSSNSPAGQDFARLQDRAKLIDATLTINSKPVLGTIAEMIVPF